MQRQSLHRPHAIIPGLRCGVASLAVLALVFCARLALASMAVATAADSKVGTTTRAARTDAVRNIPFDRLDADARTKAMAVVKANSMFRRLPVKTVDCDPKLYLYLVRNPEVVVGIWQTMGVTDMSLTRTGAETFRAKDEAGTIANVEFLYGDQQLHILYLEGQYRGPLYPRAIKANCLMVLHSRYAQRADGRTMITSQLDTFVDVQNVGVDLVVKTFQNVFGQTSDHNFMQTADFVSELSHAVETNPRGVERLASRLKMLDVPTRSRFVQIAAQVAASHAEGASQPTDDAVSQQPPAPPTNNSTMRR